MKSKMVTIFSLTAIFIGTVALFAWIFKLPILQTSIARSLSIQLDTALCLIFGGFATFATQLQLKKNVIERKKAEKARKQMTESEERLRALFENVEGGTCLYDSQLRLVAFNRVFANIIMLLTGREPIIGETAYNFLPGKEKDHRHAILNQVLMGNKGSVETEYERNGRINYFKSSFTPVVVDGEVTGISSYTVDLTASREAENKTRRYEANLKTILDTTETAYVLLDKDLKVMAFNNMARQFIGRQFDRVPAIGGDLADYFLDETYSRFLQHTEAVLKGNNIQYEINYLQPDGAIFWYNVRLFPIINNKKEIFGLMMELSDVTERKDAEESLKMAYNAIQDHVNSMKDIAWKQSHLVRSPLANLKGLTVLLELDPTDDQVLDNMKEELERLDGAIVELVHDAYEQSL